MCCSRIILLGILVKVLVTSFAVGSDLEVAKQLHQKLWEEVFLNYECETRAHVNSKEKVLGLIEFYKGGSPHEGSIELLIPEDIAPHIASFSFLEIKGTGLSQIRSLVRVTPGARIFIRPQSRNDALIRVPVDELKGWDSAQEVLEIIGTAHVEAMALVSLEGVPREFNEGLFVLPGMDRPKVKCRVKVNSEVAFFMNGEGTIDKRKFHRLYVQPGSMCSALEPVARAKGFVGGRQMIKLGPELETRHDSFRPPLMGEDPNRSGYADLSIFEKRSFDHFAEVPKDMKFAFSLDFWPSFMEASIPEHSNDRGTPRVELFDAAAELAAAYISDEIKDSGRTANYWEIKNESDVPYEWVYHASKKHDGWRLLGEFHNTVAKKVKASQPTLKLGGPASAWPRMEMGRPAFYVWENHRSFMNDTKDHLEFYSHHFYEKGSAFTFDARYNGYDGWLQGRLSCVLDMLDAEMRSTGNIKPLIISEYGTLLGGLKDSDYWLRVTNHSSFMMEFMSRPHQIELAVPFLLGLMHWEPNSGYALVRKDDTGTLQLTKGRYFMDLWEGFGGQMLEVAIDGPERVKALACADGKNLYLAINNLSEFKLSVEPELLFPEGLKIENLNYRTATYKEGSFEFIESPLKSGALVDCAIGETVVIIAEMDSAIKPIKDLKRSDYFAKFDAPFDPFNAPDLSIDLRSLRGSGSLSSVKLVVGLYQKHGARTSIYGTINDFPFESELILGEGITHFFEPIEIPIPLDFIEENNEILFNRMMPAGSIISYVKLVVEQ